jgi:hypothetical protein
MDWRIIRDGNSWCAIGPDFRDLATSLVGWGETPDQAREALAIRCLEKPDPISVPPISDFRVHA